jgi:hypothetical protein
MPCASSMGSLLPHSIALLAIFPESGTRIIDRTADFQ